MQILITFTYASRPCERQRYSLWLTESDEVEQVYLYSFSSFERNSFSLFQHFLKSIKSHKYGLDAYQNYNNHSPIQAMYTHKQFSEAENCQICRAEVLQVVIKTSPDLSLACREGDQLRSVQLSLAGDSVLH